MVAENRLVVISGTNWGAGSQTASISVLVAQSGGIFIPVQCDDGGYLLTSGLN
jgi:hypothetical protein